MKVLEVKNLEKHLNKKLILNDVSFNVKSGEIYGFLGPNGAGKTTTIKCIMGFIKQEKGTIKVFGEKGLTLKSRKDIGFMPENTYLYKYLTGEEFLRFSGKFFKISEKDLNKRISELLKKVGLEGSGNRFLNTYSKGMLQRIGLAQSIINNPKLLFLDEPMSGLDPIGRKMVKDLLVDLKNKGTTIFFNTHILADVESICDKISIIHKGHLVVESMKVSELKESLEDYFIKKINEVEEKVGD
ncbi:ABC transporter [Candidatus Gracilibacteria bacterium]|nr:MAG: ABC transporter [Candidatus Gracilibacteria bacterium]PIE85614.1 MAG: ABC transporter [Candidatus Gracilibacteria bacterium]